MTGFCEQLSELGLLVARVIQPRDRPKGAFGGRRSSNHLGHGEDVLLDFWSEAEQPHDLGDPCARDPFPAGDGRLAGYLGGLEKGLPRDGFAEQVDHPGRPRSPGWLGRPAQPWHGAHNPFGGHPSRHGPDVAALERSLGAQGNLDRLLAVGDWGRPVSAVRGDVDDPEPDLGFGPSESGSNTVTFGEPEVQATN